MSQKEEGKFLALSTPHVYFYGYRPASQGLPAFLFLHDFPSTSVIWSKVVERLLGLGFGIIRPALLGFGKTSKPTDVHDYSIRRMCLDMVEILVHHQLDSVIDVGHGV
ncbi:putative epoxide hydrolase [Paraphaeosphaeria sporulosa]